MRYEQAGNGERAGVPIARKHRGWYSAGLAGAAEFRSAVNAAGEAATVRGFREFWGQKLGADGVNGLVH